MFSRSTYPLAWCRPSQSGWGTSRFVKVTSPQPSRWRTPSTKSAAGSGGSRFTTLATWCQRPSAMLVSAKGPRPLLPSASCRVAAELVERYHVAVSVAIHAPGRQGDDRNYHAHILFTTRDMLPDGLGKKTRVLDDRKTGPQEVLKLRELAADIINESLAAVNADIRVDHRSFKDRGIEQEPTTHLGPSATEMERRGEPSERGEINRQAERGNTSLDE